MNEQKRDALEVVLDWYERGLKDGRREALVAVEAALRLIAPDHITPMGARQVRAAMEKAEGER